METSRLKMFFNKEKNGSDSKIKERKLVQPQSAQLIVIKERLLKFIDKTAQFINMLWIGSDLSYLS